MSKIECGVGAIKGCWIFDTSDCVFDENGKLLRLKRKYGKFKRPIYYWKKGEKNPVKFKQNAKQK